MVNSDTYLRTRSSEFSQYDFREYDTSDEMDFDAIEKIESDDTSP